jgi:hypothetical protein
MITLINKKFLFKARDKVEKYYIDSDGDCFKNEKAFQMWDFGDKVNKPHIDYEFFGEVVPIYQTFENGRLVFCYKRYLDELVEIEDWMGKYLDPEIDTEYFI